MSNSHLTKRALGGAHVPLTKLFIRLAMNKTILKPRVAAATGAQYLYVGFPDVIKFKVPVHTISEIGIRFRHPDYNPDRAQKLISSSMSRHLSTRDISSKSMHAFLSNLANRQTNKRRQTHLSPPLSEVNNNRWCPDIVSWLAVGCKLVSGHICEMWLNDAYMMHHWPIVTTEHYEETIYTEFYGNIFDPPP